MIKRLTEWQEQQRAIPPEPNPKPHDDKVQFELDNRKQSLDKTYAKWRYHHLMRGISEKDAKTVALILDNQSVWQCPDGEFRPIGLELVSRVFQNFVPFDLISVQPMRAPADTVFHFKFCYSKPNPDGTMTIYDHNGNVAAETPKPEDELPEIRLVIEGEDIVAKTRKVVTYTDDVMVMGKPHPLLLAEKMRDAITHEILTDLWRNVGTVSKRQVEELDWEKVYIDIVCMSGVIHRKTLRGGTDWLVVSPAIAKLAWKGLWTPPLEIDSLREVTQVGTMNCRWRLFVDPKMEGHKLLCGAFPNRHDSGYIYSPYIFAGPTPGGVKDDGSTALPGVLTRYGKKLTRYGGKYFGKIEYEITSSPG